jgi:F420-dependent methylenetetrahydromethanopterin dehydrogenase
MPSQHPTAAEFLDAKAEILQTAREAKATDGIIANGHEMEGDLVSGNKFISEYFS